MKLQKQFRSRGVVVIGLSTEDSIETAPQVRAWVREFAVNYRIGWSTPDVTVALLRGERDVIPQTFVISPGGRIVRRLVGFNLQHTPAQWRLAIKEALNDKAVPAEPE
jgi:peroxiredoxin